jgi:hypothetical protein
MTEEKKIKVVATLRWEHNLLLFVTGEKALYAGAAAKDYSDGTWHAIIDAWLGPRCCTKHPTEAEAMSAVEAAVIAALGGEVVE